MISGTGTQSVIVRGWGLDAGVDTKLTVQKFPSGEVLMTNDNWQTQAASATAIPTAYQMPKGTDAAVWLNLPAGAYTATLESVGMKGLGLIGVDAVGDDSDCSSVTPPTTTTYPLNTTVQGSGKVTSVPAGIDCGTDCTETYTTATMVTLTATANANATFKGWSGACVGTGISTSVTLDTAKNCTATFEAATTTVESCNTTNTSCPILNTLMPPSEGVVAWLGSGLDGDRNQLKQVTCLNGTSRTITGGSAKLSTSLVFDYEDVLEQQITKGGGSLSIGFFNAHANTKYEKIFHQTSYSQAFLFDYVVNLGDTLFDANPSNPLTYTTNDPCEFRRFCGDQYVCQVGSGGKVSVQMDFEFNNQFQKRDFSLSAGAGIKDWKKTICGACGSQVISISGNLDAEVSKLSQTTKSSGQLRITASQEGGRPEQLVQVIGANTTTCSLTNITACKKVLDDVVNYVSGEGFVGSLRELPPATLDYKYCPYGQIPGVPLLNTDVTPEITAARQELATKYRERLAALEKVRDLLQFSLSPTRYQRLQSLEQTFSGEVAKIGQAGQGCFKDLSNCLKNECEVLGSLTSYDPKELEFQLDDGLVAYYPFDMDTQDASGNGHQGNAVGLIAYVPGKRGQAASFDGNSYIQIPDTKAFQSWKNRSVTLAAWVQVVDNGDYRPFITLSDTDAYPLVGIGKLAYNYSNAGISLQVLDHVGHAVRIYSLDDGNTLPKKTWLHVVGVVDYENLQTKLYVNGVLQQVAKLGINVDMSQATSLTLLIGKFAHYGSKHYGLMDEAMIYGRALSEAEIQQLYSLNYTLNFE